ncbi:amylo-alpha-1,6-glucosidase [Ruegeria sp. HKCCD7255]|uniref:amylo-alpha-1,6-glucosidase n=1 Tax=Ruegeria sp. HKCCD7255 TaxID=2683004 RepID=UPI00148975F8|nr:trehalase family glycosidase [Ruegeria sp. HKCCD7255]
MNNVLYDQAVEILERNDLGHYTVPTHGLYPFQWNWDSALSALGQYYINESRAWTEIETLFEHQWEDGMVPHIIFHKEDDGYFPGPEVWATNRKVPSSGITQPPVTGFAIRRLYDRAHDKDMAQRRAKALLPKIAAWHNWFFANRDPDGTGLVAIIHPWESGRDNSIDWDDAFSRVPTEGVGEFTRRDTMHADPAHRPTKEQYQRYIWLVQHFRSLSWDNSLLHDASPFRVVDPGFNAILLRSCADLAALAEELGDDVLATEQRRLAEKGLAAMETLWSDKHQQYLCFDRAAEALIDSPSIGGLLPVFARIEQSRADAIAARIDDLGRRVKYLIPSHDPDVEGYDGARYWRGPSWLIVNYMISDGLLRDGHKDTADRIIADSMKLIHIGGFAEYFDPMNGAPCGGPHFTWTAAMVIEFLKLTGEVA